MTSPLREAPRRAEPTDTDADSRTSGIQRVAAVFAAAANDTDAHRRDPADARCVVCDAPSFGEQCPCCAGELCTDHDHVLHRWCNRCEATYRTRRGVLERVLLGSAVTTSLLAVAGVAASHLRNDTFLRGFSAAALLAWVLVTFAAVVVRGIGRATFRASAGG